MTQSAPVNRFHEACIGNAVLRDGNALFTLDHAGHAGTPQQLPVYFRIDELFQITQERQRFRRARQRRGDEFQQCLGVISGDPRVGQRRSQRRGVRRLGNAAIRADPQAFLLKTGFAMPEGGFSAGIDEG